MQTSPYFCPNCRSNRVKFSLITSTKLRFMKDAMSGEITERAEPILLEQADPSIQCMVCQFTTNELRFIKQAEREPRTATVIETVYK